MSALKSETFGLMKTLLDAHTMGIHAAEALLKDCGYNVIISPPRVEEALGKIAVESNQHLLIEWIAENRIERIGVSYRLDPDTAVYIIERLVSLLKREGLYESSSAIVKSIYFAGLAQACEKIDEEYSGRIRTFKGGETAEEMLLVMGVPQEEIPKQITEGCKYDKELFEFGKKVINKEEYKNFRPLDRVQYPEFGTFSDTLLARLSYNFKGGFQPLIRAHSGPFSMEMSREHCLKEYNDWCKALADAGYLDILSIGSSQLSQSNFGENWDGKANGGGVPINSEREYRNIWNAAKPMLVRTYSGTKHIEVMAEIYEKTINMAWHALSLWWFNELDGRGMNSLYANLKEHISTMKYVARTGKPIETNVSHHFAFRGCDDVTYIVSAYLAAKMAKKCGTKIFILQNMLNTPRSTWGVQDIAKSRAMLSLIKRLQDERFKVILQTRAGLDYFKPNLEQAKVQLAAVTAMMDDIDPWNIYIPEIIHVVSYCEALFLATPDILNDSIKITRSALNEYRKLKKDRLTPNVMSDDIKKRSAQLESDAKKIIKVMEENIVDLYSPEGFYIAFTAGWLPVPELWSDSEEFVHARNWQTKMSNGGVHLAEHNLLMTTDTKIDKCISNIADAKYILKNKYLRNK